VFTFDLLVFILALWLELVFIASNYIKATSWVIIDWGQFSDPSFALIIHYQLTSSKCENRLWVAKVIAKLTPEMVLELEMCPDPTQGYFRAAVNKRLTRLWPGYFLTQLEKIFWPEGKNWKFGIFRGNFPNPNQRWLTRPNLTRVKKIWPRPITN